MAAARGSREQGTGNFEPICGSMVVMMPACVAKGRTGAVARSTHATAISWSSRRVAQGARVRVVTQSAAAPPLPTRRCCRSRRDALLWNQRPAPTRSTAVDAEVVVVFQEVVRSIVSALVGSVVLRPACRPAV